MHLLRRRTELGLIVVVVLITAGAYALAGLGKTSEMPANIGPFLGVILGLLVTAHIAVRRLAPNADSILLPLAALLNGIGYVFIVRLDEAQEESGSLAELQSLWTAVGIGAFVATLLFVRRARDLERYRYTFAALGLFLLVLPLFPVIGRTINGSRIWIRWVRSTSSRVKQPRSCSPSSSPATWWSAARSWPCRTSGSVRCTCPTPSTSDRWRWRGARRSS